MAHFESVPHLFKTQQMDKGYDNASFFYDRLSALVFGRQLHDAQAYFLHLIPVKAKVLIVGGGSGWILQAIDEVHPEGLLITYIDASPKMTAKARDGYHGSNLVDFIPEAILEVEIAGKYDVVITPFFFDNFKEREAAAIFNRLNNFLEKGGLWLYTDFKDSSVTTHKLLLKSMYLFFFLLCGVKARKLPDMEQLFGKHGYILKEENEFVKGFVESRVRVK